MFAPLRRRGSLRVVAIFALRANQANRSSQCFENKTPRPAETKKRHTAALRKKKQIDFPFDYINPTGACGYQRKKN